MITKSHDQMGTQKTRETDLMQKELTQIGLREKELKQLYQQLNKNFNDCKDSLRYCAQELDTRTKENDHLVSLLEDQE
jgi:hypothetical protein